jgi:hypothetical protein
VLPRVTAEWDQAARLLPSMASSLAYTNYQAWQQEQGAALPDVAPGVSIEQLYREGERQVGACRNRLRIGCWGQTCGRGSLPECPARPAVRAPRSHLLR